MLSETVSLPVWLAYPMFALAALGIWGSVLGPLIRRAIQNRERHLKNKLDAKLSRPLPKVLRTNRRALIELLYNDAGVQSAISTAAAETDTDRDDIARQAREYIDELMPAFFALFYFHIGYWLARRYLRSMYDIKLAKRPPPDGYQDIPANASIVLVGNHRSNMDVVVLCYLAARTNMISFAAGEWAAVWPINHLIHLSGSYIIRRDSQSRLYKQVLARYIDMMINAHMPQGIFLEGGLTRDGAIQPVKLGLLRYILATLGKGNVSDIVFIPVAFNYDRVPEDRTLLKHQTRGFANKSKYYALSSMAHHAVEFCLRMLRTRRPNFGQAAVSFGPPLSMQEWLSQRGEAVNNLKDDQCKAMVAPVAQTIIEHIQSIIPVLPVSVIATVFYEHGNEPMSELELKKQALALIERFRRRGAVLLVENGAEEQAISRGREVLLSRHILLQEEHAYRINRQQQPLLEYYYRTTKHFLLDDSEDIEVVREPPLQSVLTVPEPRAM